VRLGRAEAAMILASALRRAQYLDARTAQSQGPLPKRIGCAPTEADAQEHPSWKKIASLVILQITSMPHFRC
jgi:hypothetical protein